MRALTYTTLIALALCSISADAKPHKDKHGHKHGHNKHHSHKHTLKLPFEICSRINTTSCGYFNPYNCSIASKGSFKVWRKRHAGRKTKHLKLRDPAIMRSHCKTQYKQR